MGALCTEKTWLFSGRLGPETGQKADLCIFLVLAGILSEIPANQI